MASVTITLASLCAGGGHQTFNVTGAVTKSFNTEINISESLTADECEAFLKTLVRLAKIGRTNAQVRTLFEDGVTVTV